jgi:hypothetical protein
MINLSLKQPDQAQMKLETAGSGLNLAKIAGFSSKQAGKSRINFKSSWKHPDQAQIKLETAGSS